MKCIGMALLSFVLTTLFFSCVKEQGRDECSLGYYIVLGIRDKNFSNINTITGLQLKSEQLAFRQYVSSLSYRLENRESGETVMETEHQEVEDNRPFVKIDLPEWVSGNYRLSLFGNVREHLELRAGQSIYRCIRIIRKVKMFMFWRILLIFHPDLLKNNFSCNKPRDIYLFNWKACRILVGSDNPFPFHNNKKIRHWLVQPELRLWTCQCFAGHFLGLHAHYEYLMKTWLTRELSMSGII